MNKLSFRLLVAVCAAALALAAPGRVVRDVSYAPSLGADGLGDLYLPDVVRPETPLILVIHGGGWSALHRPSMAGIAEFFRRDLGFAAFNIEYRLASAKNPWPACGDDCVTAAKFVLSDEFRAQYGLRHRKIWITGGSAGGHLVLWTLVKLPPELVAGAVSISAIGDPLPDFRAHRGRYVPLFGKDVTEDMLEAMNPIPLIRKGMAPLLCTHADADKVVPIASHRAFADAYRAAGNGCDFYEYRHDEEPNEGGHFIWRRNSNPHRLLSCLESRISAFVREHRTAADASPPGACPADGVSGAAIGRAVARGVKYLVAQQAPDGHFSDAQMPALTALPLWALVRGGEARGDAAQRAAAFVLRTQRPDGGFYVPKPGRGGSGLGNYNTSVCVSALYESGLAPVQAILAARTYIAGSQLTGDDTMAGGFGYDRTSRRRYADLSNTSYAMDAMRRTEKAEDFRPKGQARADLNWEKALAFVTHLQEREGERAGGVAYNDRTPQGGVATNVSGRVQLRAYGSMSYAAVLSMCHAKLTRADPRVKSALDYCSKFWTVDENPGMGNQGLYYYYDILSRALSVAGVDELVQPDGRRVNWKRELAAKLIALQRPDGSWMNDNNRFWENDPVLATSFAILSLSMCAE